MKVISLLLKEKKEEAVGGTIYEKKKKINKFSYLNKIKSKNPQFYLFLRITLQVET